MRFQIKVPTNPAVRRNSKTLRRLSQCKRMRPSARLASENHIYKRDKDRRIEFELHGSKQFQDRSFRCVGHGSNFQSFMVGDCCGGWKFKKFQVPGFLHSTAPKFQGQQDSEVPRFQQTKFQSMARFANFHGLRFELILHTNASG